MDEGRGVIDRLKQVQEQCLNMLIKPHRNEYHPEDLGPVSQELRQQIYLRKDFVVPNREGHLLCCSFYEGRQSFQEFERSGIDISISGYHRARDLLVYCHSQSGNRMEGAELLDLCAKYKWNLLVFDFAGCGISGGQYVSLGWFEHEDIKRVIDQTKSLFHPENIFLWGRSMGAVAASLYASRHQNTVKALVLDSPFDDLMVLAKSIAVNRLNIPSMLLSLPLLFITKKLREILGVNLLDLKPREDIEKLTLPVFFISCKEEEVLPPGCVQSLYSSCLSKEKVISYSEGEHGSVRDERVIKEAFFFLFKYSTSKDSNASMSDMQRSFALNKTVSRQCFGHTSCSALHEDPEPSERLYDPFLLRGVGRGRSQCRESASNRYDDSRREYHCNQEPAETKKIIISPTKIESDTQNRTRGGQLTTNFSFSTVCLADDDDARGKRRPPASYARGKLCSIDFSADQLKILATKKIDFKRTVNPLKQSLSDIKQVGILEKYRPQKPIAEIQLESQNRAVPDNSGSSRGNFKKEGPMKEFNTFISSIVSSIPSDPYMRADPAKPRLLSLSKRKDSSKEEWSKIFIPEELRKTQNGIDRLRVLPTPSYLKADEEHSIKVLESSILTTPVLNKTQKPGHQFSSALPASKPRENPLKLSYRESADFGSVLRLNSTNKKPSILMTSLSRSNIHIDQEQPGRECKGKTTVKVDFEKSSTRTTQGVYRPFLEVSFDKENMQPNKVADRLRRVDSCSVRML